MIEAGLVASCAMIDFELLWSTRNVADFDELSKDRRLGYEYLPIEDAQWHRAIEVQRELWANGLVRAVPLPDLLIAAVAERHGVTALHYDADYDRIAAVTGQVVQWIVEPGSVA